MNVEISGIQFDFICFCSRQTMYGTCNSLLQCTSVCREDKPTGYTVFGFIPCRFSVFRPKWPSLEIAAELLGSWNRLEVSTVMLLLFWHTSCNLKIFAKCVNLLGVFFSSEHNFVLISYSSKL